MKSLYFVLQIKKKSSFTILELVIVLGVIGILGLLGYNSLIYYRNLSMLNTSFYDIVSNFRLLRNKSVNNVVDSSSNNSNLNLPKYYLIKYNSLDNSFDNLIIFDSNGSLIKRDINKNFYILDSSLQLNFECNEINVDYIGFENKTSNLVYFVNENFAFSDFFGQCKVVLKSRFINESKYFFILLNGSFTIL